MVSGISLVGSILSIKEVSGGINGFQKVFRSFLRFQTISQGFHGNS